MTQGHIFCNLVNFLFFFFCRTIYDSFAKCGFMSHENEDFEEENEFPEHLIGAATEHFDCPEPDLLPDIENNLEVDFDAANNFSTADADQIKKESPCSLKECYEVNLNTVGGLEYQTLEYWTH